ncbi:integrase [Yersinia pseudotuberculosis]|nr:integrase [Yersinia pseudotuberculosis]
MERQMSHQERNGVRAAYIHKAEFLDELRLMLQWLVDFLDTNKRKAMSPLDFAEKHPQTELNSSSYMQIWGDL